MIQFGGSILYKDITICLCEMFVLMKSSMEHFQPIKGIIIVTIVDLELLKCGCIVSDIFFN